MAIFTNSNYKTILGIKYQHYYNVVKSQSNHPQYPCPTLVDVSHKDGLKELVSFLFETLRNEYYKELPYKIMPSPKTVYVNNNTDFFLVNL